MTRFNNLIFNLILPHVKLLLPHSILKVDNLVVRGKLVPRWLVVQSSPLSKAAFLNNILKNKFPSYSFIHSKWLGTSFHKKVDDAVDGMILELKSFSEATLSIFDRMNKVYSGVPKILVLTPSAYQWLNSKRKGSLDHSLVVLSETKSLDYILQLPRFIEEVGKKRRLRMQNERLQRMIEKKMPQLGSFASSIHSGEPMNTREIIKELLISDEQSQGAPQCGLKLKLVNWKRMTTSLGLTAQTEIVETLSRLVNGIVRNSDRVLRSAEDEFLIFLSNAQPTHLSRCKERLQKALNSFEISADSRSLKLPIKILPLEQAASLSH